MFCAGGYYLQILGLRICLDIGLDGVLTALGTVGLGILAYVQMRQLAKAEAQRFAERQRFALSRAALTANELRRQLQSWIAEASPDMKGLVQLVEDEKESPPDADKKSIDSRLGRADPKVQAAVDWIRQRATAEHLGPAEARVREILLRAVEAEHPEANLRAIRIRTAYQYAASNLNKLADALTRGKHFSPELAAAAYIAVKEWLTNVDLFLEIAAEPYERPIIRV